MKHYIVPHLNEERPGTCVIQGGGNDLPTSRNSPTPVLDIAKDLIDTAMACKDYGVKNILVSSVMPRNIPYMQFRRRQLNNLLRDLCTENNFTFIDNDNIVLSEHISGDGVHLNRDGTNMLSENFLDYLNRI